MKLFSLTIFFISILVLNSRSDILTLEKYYKIEVSDFIYCFDELKDIKHIENKTYSPKEKFNLHLESLESKEKEKFLRKLKAIIFYTKLIEKLGSKLNDGIFELISKSEELKKQISKELKKSGYTQEQKTEHSAYDIQTSVSSFQYRFVLVNLARYIAEQEENKRIELLSSLIIEP